MPAMTGQFFFTTVAGLALSLAGFSTIVTALRDNGRWSTTWVWRLRVIVGESLTITVVAMLPLPIFYATGGDEPLTIRLISAILAGKFLIAIWKTLREETHWGRRYVVQAVVTLAIQAGAQLVNLYVGSLALLMVGVLAWLYFPIQLLFRIIDEFQPPTEGD
jgi:hypothetical protein